MGLAIALVVHGLRSVHLCVCVFIGREVGEWEGGALSDLNTSDIVVSPGRNSWSAGERGGRGAGIRRGRDGRQCATLIMGLG